MSVNDLIKVAAESRERKQNELQALEMSGVKLPMSIADIIAIEQRGDVVDLDTGAIIPGGAEQQVAVTAAAVRVVPFRR